MQLGLPLVLFAGPFFCVALWAGWVHALVGVTGFVVQPRSYSHSHNSQSSRSIPIPRTLLYSTKDKNVNQNKNKEGTTDITGNTDTTEIGHGHTSSSSSKHNPKQGFLGNITPSFTFKFKKENHMNKQSRYDAAAIAAFAEQAKQAQATVMKQVQELETKAAVESLKQLLQRQTTDLQETKMLLETMEATVESLELELEDGNHGNANNIASHEYYSNSADLFTIGGVGVGVGGAAVEAHHSITPTSPSLLQSHKFEKNNKQSESQAQSPPEHRYSNDTRTASIMAAANYGFKSRSEGGSTTLQGGGTGMAEDPFPGYGPPGNLWELGWQQFMRNVRAMRGEYEEDYDYDNTAVLTTPRQRDLQKDLMKLTLNTTAIWEREGQDPSANHDDAPYIVKIPYFVLCVFLDQVFDQKYVPSRFFFLETVARMPYFSYIGMLHTYETLGFWRRSATVKRIHFAEEWNEFHHLLIMESLGGDQRWWVRFLAQHSAFTYFFALVALFIISPSSSYKFSEMLETHAFHTYSQFLDENEKLLKSLPPPTEAVEYYTIGASDPLFSEYQTGPGHTGTANSDADGDDADVQRLSTPSITGRSTNMQTLFDVFSAIRDDEGDHVTTMQACLDPTVAVRNPATQRNFLTGLALTAAVSASLAAGSGMVDMDSLDMESFDIDSLLDLAQSLGTSTGSSMTGLTDALGGVTDAADVAELASASSGVLDAVFAAFAAAAAVGNQALRDGAEIGTGVGGELGAGGADGELGASFWEAVVDILSRII